ncbi:MAG: hypothetical protein ACREH4_15860 [Vitreimonas sp.]
MDLKVRPVAMSAYRFFVVDEFDRVSSLQWRECACDAEAKAVAESLASAGSGVEVWEIGRLVSKLPCTRQTG